MAEVKEKNTFDMSSDVLLILQKDIAEIKVALLGNEYNPDGGLLYRAKYMEDEIDKLKKRYEKIIWTAGGAGAAISFIISLLTFYFDKISILMKQ